MSQTAIGQVGKGIRIAGLTTVCLLFLLTSAVFGYSPTTVLIGLCIFVFAIALPPAIPSVANRLRDVDPFSPYIMFPIAYILWFVGGSINFIDAPSALAFGAFDPIPSWMYGLYACGLAGYFSGIYVGRFLPTTDVSLPRHDLDFEKLQRLLSLTVLITVASWIFLALEFGVTILHPETANSDRLAHRGIAFQLLVYLGWTAFILFPVFTWARGPNQRRAWIPVVAVPAALGLLVVSLGVGRSNVVPPLVTLVIARSYIKKQSLRKVVAFGVVSFAVLSILGYFRGALSETTATPEVSLMGELGVPAPVVPLVDMSLYVRFTVAALRDLTQIVPSSTPYRHGAMSFMPLTTFLPGHQDMSDIVFKNMLDRTFEGSGQPATLLAPLYVDFGWTGVFVGMSAYGAILSWSYRRMKASPTPVRITYYAWWLQCTLLALYANGFAYVNVFLIPLFWMFLYSFAKPTLTRAETAIDKVNPELG